MTDKIYDPRAEAERLWSEIQISARNIPKVEAALTAAFSAGASSRDAEVEALRGADWGDKPLPEDDAISAAHPTRSGRHDEYAEAMRLVGARRSKGALVGLVTWLLVRNEALRGALAQACDGWDASRPDMCDEAKLARLRAVFGSKP